MRLTTQALPVSTVLSIVSGCATSSGLLLLLFVPLCLNAPITHGSCNTTTMVRDFSISRETST